jgi:hypothetical protein
LFNYCVCFIHSAYFLSTSRSWHDGLRVRPKLTVLQLSIAAGYFHTVCLFRPTIPLYHTLTVSVVLGGDGGKVIAFFGERRLNEG